MKRQAPPLLSIGIIFKNDIRCIERCLKALQPLREAIPCELVMADTGSTDGSREIAERYADRLIDFPWIDDFSAARNAVMNQASGLWYLSVDTDEYLKENVSQMVQFLAVSEQTAFQAATVIVRNYDTYEMDGVWDDFMALRLVRMSTGVRYEGAVHEHWEFGGNVKVFALSEIVFDHDGYVETCKGTEAGKAKRERNMKLIRETLEKRPNDLMTRMQVLESGWQEADYVEQIYKSVELVKAKVPGWEKAGPPLLRYAIYTANGKKLPELDEWLQLMEDWFPKSVYNRLDVTYIRISQCWEERDYFSCIQHSERFLQAMKDFRNGADVDARMFSTLKTANPTVEQSIKIILAGAYQYEGQTERALKLLEEVDCTLLNEKYTSDLLKVIQEIQLKTYADTSSLVVSIWQGLTKPEPSQRRADERKKCFIQIAGVALEPKTRMAEEAKEGFCRNRYTMYLPLRGICEPGTAAALLQMQQTEEMEAALAEVQNWDWFSIHALAYALECGARFPLPGRIMNIEELSSIASRLTKSGNNFFSLVLRLTERIDAGDWMGLVWASVLVSAAVRVYPWAAGEPDIKQGVALAKTFARIEKTILPLSYSETMFEQDRMFALPPLHRFGFYCARAFDALDAGDRTDYIRLLREGLAICEVVKDIVEFLIDNTPELKNPSEELTALAEQIRTVLEKFSPSDPAVTALKQSEAYQKVAYLIEGIAPPIVGGLSQ